MVGALIVVLCSSLVLSRLAPIIFTRVLVPNPQKACCNGLSASAFRPGAYERMRRNSGRIEGSPTRRACGTAHVVVGDAAGLVTKQIDFLMRRNEIKMRVERVA